jgi:hypothetical protein
MDVLEKQIGDYFVRLLVCNKNDGFTWNLVVVYGDAQQARKAPFLIEIVHIILKSKVPLMVTGDFNMTKRSSDKNKTGGFIKWSILFNSVISQGELMEIPLSGQRYTWSIIKRTPLLNYLTGCLSRQLGRKISLL